ncbi:CBS domain-containing protein [Aquibacillus saliphilus]|uniref:CBS domain-containing protein n=1 Tax=Aquibacillus saliphilus TaxID=1909422 RepID=UPI001CF051E6|nr:CBS domain-containing protein [Aquibacillus saliphilus]
MKAHEIMINKVHKVNEGDTVRSVIEKFIEHNISGLPVVTKKDEIVAYISDGDIMRYIGKHKDIVVDSMFFVNIIKGDEQGFEDRLKNIIDLNVLTIAKKRFIKVDWQKNIEDVAAILGEKQIKKLPVERDGKLVGIISRGDVIRNAFNRII